MDVSFSFMLHQSWVYLLYATNHIESCKHVAVMMAGFQVLGDVRERGQIFRVLRGTRDVPDLVLSYDVLHVGKRERNKRKRIRFKCIFV